MNTQASRPAPARQTLPTSNFLSELGREQLATSNEAACNWFRCREAVRQAQQEMAHQALAVHESAVQKLRDSTEPADLLGVQSELLRFYIQSPAQYWEQVAKTSLYTQVEMMARLNHLFVGRTGDGMRWALSRFQAALPANAASLDANDNAAPTPIDRISSGDVFASQASGAH